MIDLKTKKISIITVVFNSVNSIENTIKCVISQKKSDTEYIVIDGGSTDGTKDIIKKYANVIDYWKSEPDNGIYDAWNKGLKVASGKIIGFLNSGDVYKDGTLDLVKNSNIFNDESILSYGNTIFIDNKNKIVGYNKKEFNARRICTNFGFIHTTCFVPKLLYDKIGHFNTNYKIGADVEWLLRAYLNGVKFVNLQNTTYMLIGGVSQKYLFQGLIEYRNALLDLKFNRINIEIGFVENIIKNALTGIPFICKIFKLNN